VTLTAEGEACDDGVACTKDTSCDGSGVCGTGTNDDTECNDDVFCNGVETCDPGAEGATSDGCAAGVLVAQDPMYDDGNECTQTFCDEDTQSVVHGPTLDCDCRTPDDCRAASPDDACGIFECDTGTGFTCQRVQGMFEDPGVVCDDQVPCTGNDVCQPDGQCEGTPSAAFCAVSSPDAICAPDSDQADEDGCATP